MSPLNASLAQAFIENVNKSGFAGFIKRNEPLAAHVAYHIGGPADIYAKASSENDVKIVLDQCEREGMPLTILGCGTNLLIRDGGIRGVVLHLGWDLNASSVVLNENDDEIRVRVPGHVAKATLLDWALERNWAGLEFSAGIPGTLGGAVFMNAGTKWGSYADVIERVRFYSAARGFVELSNEQIGFRYRGTGEGLLDGKTAVLSVDLKLSKKKSASEIRALVDEILSYRGGKQPLELPNCGSVFKNPPNSARGAGRLIEASQLKGLRVGQAEVSMKHANFILNLGGARASDVEALIKSIQEKVFADHGIHLEPEVIILGEA